MREKKILKKGISLLLSILMVLPATTSFAYADDKVINEEAWSTETLLDGTLKITALDMSQSGLEDHSNIDELNIPSNIDGKTVTELGSQLLTFDCDTAGNTVNVKKIVIPSTIKEISTKYTEDSDGNVITASTFAGNSQQLEYEVANDNQNYCAVKGILYTKDMKTLINCPGGITGNVRIPDSVTTLSDFCCAGICGLVGLYIPDGVTELPLGMIEETSSGFQLQHLRLPDGLKVLDCNALMQDIDFDLEIPESVTSITPITFGYNYEYRKLADATLYGHTNYVKNFAADHNIKYVDANAAPIDAYDYSKELKIVNTDDYFDDWHIYQNMDYDTCTVDGYRGTDKNIVIPDTIGGLKVVGIYMDNSFPDDTISIQIPATMLDIRTSGFPKRTGDDRLIIIGYKHTFAETFVSNYPEYFKFEQIGGEEYKHDCQFKIISENEADCFSGGTKTYMCTICGKIYTENTPALEDDWQIESKKDATCTEGGYINYICSRCHRTKTETLKATGHSYEITSHKEATCTTNGYNIYTCKNCGSSYTEEIIGNHDFGDDGFNEKCDRCGEINPLYVKKNYKNTDEIVKEYPEKNTITLNMISKTIDEDFEDAWTDNKTQLIILNGEDGNNMSQSLYSKKAIFCGCDKIVVGLGNHTADLKTKLANDKYNVTFDNITLSSEYKNVKEGNETEICSSDLTIKNCQINSKIITYGNTLNCISSDFKGKAKMASAENWDEGTTMPDIGIVTSNKTNNIINCSFSNLTSAINSMNATSFAGIDNNDWITFMYHPENLSEEKMRKCSVNIKKCNFNSCIDAYSTINPEYYTMQSMLCSDKVLLNKIKNVASYTEQLNIANCNMENCEMLAFLPSISYYQNDDTNSLVSTTMNVKIENIKSKECQTFLKSYGYHNIELKDIFIEDNMQRISQSILYNYNNEIEKTDNVIKCNDETETNRKYKSSDLKNTCYQRFSNDKDSSSMQRLFFGYQIESVNGNLKIDNINMKNIYNLGILSKESNVEISNSNFAGNSSSSTFKWNYSIANVTNFLNIRQQGPLKINNCTFSDFYKTVSCISSANVEIKDCEFNNNLTYSCIINDGKVKIDNTKFTSNSSSILTKNGEINNCQFCNNNSLLYSNVQIACSESGTKNFQNNNLKMASEFENGMLLAVNGGAVQTYGYTKINNCNFVGNEAVNGGAIYANDLTNDNATETISKGIVTINSCNFTNNIASNNGGAIYSANEIINDIENNNTFSDNIAKNYGGAFYSSKVSLKGVKLDGSNKAQRGNYAFVIDKAVTNRSTTSEYGANICLNKNAYVECNEMNNTNTVNISTLPDDRELGRVVVKSSENSEITYSKTQFKYVTEDEDEKTYYISNNKEKDGEHLTEYYSVRFVNPITNELLSTQTKEWNVPLTLVKPDAKIDNYYDYLGYGTTTDGNNLIDFNETYNDNTDITYYLNIKEKSYPIVNPEEPNIPKPVIKKTGKKMSERENKKSTAVKTGNRNIIIAFILLITTGLTFFILTKKKKRIQ